MALLDFLYSDPSRGAQKYLNQIPGEISPYYNPFIQAGQRGMSGYENTTNQLLDPNALINKIGSGYTQSPGYQFALNQALQGSGHAAAAGGMAGSPQHEQQNMQLAQNLANQDYQQYLQNALGLYGMGYQGQGNLMNQGYNASNELANSLGNTLGTQGQLAYSGGVNRNQLGAGTLGMGLGALFGSNNPVTSWLGWNK